MPNFVDDMLPLDYPKEQTRIVFPGREAFSLPAGSWNNVCQALVDLRGKVLATVGGTGPVAFVDLAQTSIRSARAVNQSPSSTTKVGITNFGSVAPGGGTVGATADYATISGGQDNSATADYSTVVGGLDNVASGQGAIAGGDGCIASAEDAVALGDGATASGQYGSLAVGNGVTASGESSVAFGDGCTVSGDQGSIACGDGCVTSGHEGACSFGSGSVASGESAFAAGSSIASALCATAFCSSIANGRAAFSEGYSVAHGEASHAEGASTATGDYSHAAGSGAHALRRGQSAMSSNGGTNLGDNQTSNMTFDGAGSSAFELLASLVTFSCEDNKAYHFKVWAIVTGTQAGPVRKSKAFEFGFVAVRVAGTTTIVANGAEEDSYGEAATDTWTLVPSIGAGPDRLVLTFDPGAGPASDVKAVAKVSFTEVAF